MPETTPIISIVTPSYNRADELIQLYNSLQEQSTDMSIVEWIISDDGSTDSTDSLVKDWKENSPIKIKFVTQENQGPGAARNHGLENAEGDLILFIDSDCEAHPDWIKTIYSEYRNDTFDACGGPDGAKDDFSLIQKAIDYSMTSFFTTGGMRGHSEIMLAKFYPRTHNMGIRKSVYKHVGGFGDLRHGQDIEFSHRIKKSGAKIKFLKDAIVYHRRRTTLKQFFKQVFNWGVARINLGKIDSDMLELIHFMPALATLVGISTTIIVLLSQFPLDLFALIIFLPLAFLSILGTITKKEPLIFPLLIIIIPAQILGYGLGFIFNYINRMILNRERWTGFQKRYYAK